MKTISGSQVIYRFTYNMEPIESVLPGEVFKVETNDCFFQQITREDQVLTEIDYDKLNPATGPIYIEGAEPGDLLKIKILDIAVAGKGISATVPDEGALGDQVTKSTVRIINIEDGYAILEGIRVPIEPMVGVIGVAPKEEDGQLPTEVPWKHGGNMDTKDIKKGSTLYLPVNQKGALLALGDCHAAMGDGEICFTGLEVPAVVTLEVDVIKGKNIEWPLIETDEYTAVIASGDNLDEALYSAASEAVKHLKNGLNLTWEDAYILAGLSVDMRISQVVDPKKTIRATIPKNILPTEKIIHSL
jgi:amidase